MAHPMASAQSLHETSEGRQQHLLQLLARSLAAMLQRLDQSMWSGISQSHEP
jgi:hypothetical protein